MKVLVLSDLHLDLWQDDGPRFDLATSRPDVVVLAGDIHKGAHGIVWAARMFSGIPVLYVAGNHEFYDANLETVLAEMADAARQTANVHFLDADEVVVGGTRFLGCTLWTNFRLMSEEPADRQIAMEAAQGSPDYKYIRLKSQKFRKLRPSDTARFHAEQRAWLQSKLAEPFAGKTVVVTHMAPSLKSVAPESRLNPEAAVYASRLDELVSRADLWIHGHLHTSSDYPVGGGRVVCNPRGYQIRGNGPENPQFDPNCMVELGPDLL
ncbi:metallophosphoesterase [Undibacterium sp.]|jgi:predicted phosphodiesterase|uniref:metallophosphoesterase n=1 Tax=Undibacterium sp. TaxID=1914977 RepID=UPI002C3246A1|nr:metallophosphoesterase [Undibacterium sp.]HTD05227.1 metallophosphoesterase [Undibacterium sp.]